MSLPGRILLVIFGSIVIVLALPVLGAELIARRLRRPA